MNESSNVIARDPSESDEVRGYVDDRLTFGDVVAASVVSPALGLGVVLPLWALFTAFPPEPGHPKSSGSGGGVRG